MNHIFFAACKAAFNIVNWGTAEPCLIRNRLRSFAPLDSRGRVSPRDSWLFPLTGLVGHYFRYPFLLGLGQCGRDIFERREMFVDIGLGVLD